MVMRDIGLLGIKLGMSRVFNERGASIPVTVVYADTNHICQVKTKQKEGYDAVQLTAGSQKPQRVSKALLGHYKKAQIPLGCRLSEFRVVINEETQLKVGAKVSVRDFVVGQQVDLTGISKGRGFAGGIKRWNFSMQDATHGNSLSHRHLGSTGQCQFPGRVFKGKKMAGHYGAKRVTTMRLEIVEVDEENSLIFIKGAVPGSRGGWVIMRPSAKETPEERAQTNKLLKEREEQKQQTEETQAAESQGAEEIQKETDTKEETQQASDKDQKLKSETTEQKAEAAEGKKSLKKKQTNPENNTS